MPSVAQKIFQFKLKLPGSGDSGSNGNPNPLEDKGLAILARVMTLGVIGIGVVSFYASFGKLSHTLSVFGLSSLIGLVSAAVGGLLGFLFGIPITKQTASNNAPVGNLVQGQQAGQSQGSTAQTDAYGNNTNLEQISDWLTKIIVGVSLTQWNKIQQQFSLLIGEISAGLGIFMDKRYAVPFAGSLVIFFAICGFLFVYLWAKIYLKAQLLLTDRDINKIVFAVKEDVKSQVKTIDNQVKTIDNKALVFRIKQKIDQFNRERGRITLEEDKIDFQAIIQKASPGPITVLNDPQKNRWGGLPSVNGLTLGVSFDPADKGSAEPFYYLTLTVHSTDANKPLSGFVYFFLHDSFSTKIIQKVEAANNLASIRVGSYEAFTVGAFADTANTKLELDLNLFPGSPEDYKYLDKLPTIEELRQELERLQLDGEE